MSLRNDLRTTSDTESQTCENIGAQKELRFFHNFRTTLIYRAIFNRQCEKSFLLSFASSNKFMFLETPDDTAQVSICLNMNLFKTLQTFIILSTSDTFD